jgi:hypothetical protein
MIVRSRLPWPLRWAMGALMLGFCAALALWAFEFGKDISRLARGHDPQELERLRDEMALLRSERDKAQGIGDTAESLLKSERVALERLTAQIKALEAENLALKDDLGFFEHLLPAGAGESLSVRGLQAEMSAPGQMRFQLIVMQGGRRLPEFRGKYELTLSGSMDGRPWTQAMPGGARTLDFKHYRRVEGVIDVPPQAVIKAVQVRVTDASGATRAQQSLKL